MPLLDLTDETFRDGSQSLWANRLRTRDMLPAAALVADVGYGRVNLISPVGFEVAIKFLHENPLDRVRALRQLTRPTTSTVLIRGRNLFGWRRYSDDVVAYTLEALQRFGIDEIEVFDALNDSRNVEEHIRVAARLGMRVAAALTYSVSPVHTDEHFASRARELASAGATSVLLYDASGVLRPERVRPLVEAVRAAAPGVAIEMNVHDQTGLALDCYREAISLGVTSLSTAARPLAGAESVPAVADVIALADELGVEAPLDRRQVAYVDDYLTYVAHTYGKPTRNYVERDEANYQRYASHQIPGGMMSHYRSQLEGLGLLDRLPEVLEEAGRVRVEMGCPVMVTPFSQLVGVQAMFNVLDGKRYHTVPEDLRTYVLGAYGRPPGPLDPDVVDRLVRDAERVDSTELFAEPMMERVRQQLPPMASDDDLFFHLFSTESDVQQMRQAEPEPTHVTRIMPLGALVTELARRRDVTAVEIAVQGGA